MQNNNKTKKIKIAAIVLAVILCICAGCFIAYSYVNSSRFNPDISGANDVKINEVELEGETEKLSAEKTDKKNETSDLDDRRKKDGSNSDQTNPQNKKIFVTGQASKYLLNGNAGAGNSAGNMSTGDLINGIANGGNANGGNGSQNGGNGSNTNGGSQNSSSSGNSGNSSNADSADNNGDTNVIFPNVPEMKEPDREIPDDVYDTESWLPVLPSYEEGNSDNNSSVLTLSVSLADSSIATNMPDLELYEGQALTPEIILSRVWAYAMEDGSEKYRIRQIGNNFYIKDYPEKAYNGFKATFCFRQTAISDWQEITIEIPTVERKFYVASYEEGIYPSILLEIPKYLYPEKGKTLSLLACYKYMQPNQNNEMLTQLFRGWSETQNGVPIYDDYTVNKDGIIYLYPTGYVALGSEYKAKMTAKKFNTDGYLEWHQTLCGYTGSSATLSVPKYIQSVCFDELGEFDELSLPYTVNSVYFNNSDKDRTLKVKKRYTVAQDNKYLSTVDGALASKDKTIIYDIPSDTTEFSVPDTVTEVDFSDYNSNLKLVKFSSEKAPTTDISKLDHAKILVPKDSLLDYMSEWGSKIGTNEILPSDESNPEYTYSNGAILSDFGRTLYSVDDSIVGTLRLPDSVEKVPAGAINNSNIDTIIFGKSFREIENGAINADNIKRLFFLGENQVQIGSSSISALSDEDDDDDIKVYVQSDIAGSLKSEWADIIGDRANSIIIADNLSYEQNGDFEYLNTNDGAILYKTPDDIEIFNESTVSGVTIKEIGSNAFKGHEKLRIADLAESIKRIGKYAFRDCDNLEGVYSYSRDEITVDKWVFTQYKGFNSKLKYVVFNALYGYFDSEYQNINKDIFFAPYDTYGYDSEFPTNVYQYIQYYAKYTEGFTMQRTNGDERIIYAYDEYVSDSGPGYIICAATTGIEGTITLPNDTKMVQDYAFSNCQNEFKLKNYESIEFISTSGFSSSGISGEYNFKSLHWMFDCAFLDCKNITKLTFPVLITIQSLTFSGCENLEEIEFGDSLTTIMSGAFGDCSKLRTLTLSSSEPVQLATSNWGSLFYFGSGYGDTFDETKFRVLLKGEAKENMQDYLDHWYINLFGFEYDESMYIGLFYGENELAEGEKRISSLFDVEYTKPEDIGVSEWSLDDDEHEVGDTEPTEDNSKNGSENVEGQAAADEINDANQ